MEGADLAQLRIEEHSAFCYEFSIITGFWLQNVDGTSEGGFGVEGEAALGAAAGGNDCCCLLCLR